LQEGAYSRATMAVGLARVGCDDQQIVAAPLKGLLDLDFGPPLHSLIIAGVTHVLEDEILDLYKSEPGTK
jgi:diphthine synthase